MSDAPPGPGWWQASDGQWYPPHLRVDAPAPRASVATAERRADPIDWDRVAAERQARRDAVESRHVRRVVGSVLAGFGALALLVGVAGNRAGDGGLSRAAAPTTAEVSTTVATTVPPTTTAGAPGTLSVSVFDLEPGMCVDNAELSSGLVTNLTALPCEQPHSHEVYFKVAHDPPGGVFDAAALATFANEQCSQAFTAYVGMPYDRSTYYFLHLAPSAESWAEQGDRDVVCLLFKQDAKLTGSAKGTAQ